jgi:hypothetical protein
VPHDVERVRRLHKHNIGFLIVVSADGEEEAWIDRKSERFSQRSVPAFQVISSKPIPNAVPAPNISIMFPFPRQRSPRSRLEHGHRVLSILSLGPLGLVLVLPACCFTSSLARRSFREPG